MRDKGVRKKWLRSEGLEGEGTQCAENCQYCYGLILNIHFYIPGKIHYIIDFYNEFEALFVSP